MLGWTWGTRPLTWPALESLPGSPRPGKDLTVVGFTPSQVPFGSRGRGEVAAPQKVPEGCAPFFLALLWSRILLMFRLFQLLLTSFHHLNLRFHSRLNRHGVWFICSGCMELVGYVWIPNPCYKSVLSSSCFLLKFSLKYQCTGPWVSEKRSSIATFLYLWVRASKVHPLYKLTCCNRPLREFVITPNQPKGWEWNINWTHVDVQHQPTFTRHQGKDHWLGLKFELKILSAKRQCTPISFPASVTLASVSMFSTKIWLVYWISTFYLPNTNVEN